MSTSAGALAKVPDLAGLPLQDAQAVAAASGYPTRVVLRPGPEVAGTVLSQEPAAGEFLAQGAAVELHVTRGARQIGVPDVRGMPVDEARRLLAEAELTPGDVTYVPAPDKEPNRVISTAPGPGDLVDAGTAVSLEAAAP